MASFRLLIGDPSSPTLTIGEVPTDSTNSDTTLDFGDAGFTFYSSGPLVIVQFNIFVEAASVAVQDTRRNTLRDLLNNVNRSFTFKDAAGTEILPLQVGTTCSAVRCGANFLDGDKGIDVGVTLEAMMYLDADGSGSSGTVENPVGLQDTPTYEITQGDDGLLLVAVTALFKNTTGKTALENADAWSALWFTSGPPSWLPSRMKFVGMTDSDELGTPETRRTITWAQEKNRITRLGTTPSWLVGQTFNVNVEAAPVASPFGVSPERVVIVTGALTLRLDTATYFKSDNTTPETNGTMAEVMVYVRRLVTGALAEVGLTGANATGGLKVFRGDAGNTIQFSQTFAGSGVTVQWQESMSIRDERLLTILRATDGSDRKYETAGGLRTATQQWSILTLEFPRHPSAPAGWEVISVEATPPIRTRLIDADGQYAGTLYGITGSRQLRKINEPSAGAIAGADPAAVLNQPASGKDEPAPAAVETSPAANSLDLIEASLGPST